MGKDYQNFMSKKDFHPSAHWNLKKKWELEQKAKLDAKKQEELKIQYEKEQNILNNKAMLGDEKARLGLSFMYDAPTGINRKKDERPEPKFEWQRKYNAPREEWAKGNETIQDQPFGIQVRNVRCVKCRTWGHLNTDRECPLYGMSGNAENPGYANNPSDLIKELNAEKLIKKENELDFKPSTSSLKTDFNNMTTHSYTIDVKNDKSKCDQKNLNESKNQSNVKKQSSSDDEEKAGDAYYEAEAEAMRMPIDQDVLLENMREEHNLRFKTKILLGVRAEEGLKNLKNAAEDDDFDYEEKKPSMEEFVNGLSEKKRKRLFSKIINKERSPSFSQSKQKDKNSSRHKKKSSKNKPTFEEYVNNISEKKRQKLLSKIVKREHCSSSPELKAKKKKSSREKKHKQKESRERK